MKKLLSERNLVLVLFVCAFIIFSIANEDAKKLGVLQNSTSVPARFLSASPEKQADKPDHKRFELISEKE